MTFKSLLSEIHNLKATKTSHKYIRVYHSKERKWNEIISKDKPNIKQFKTNIDYKTSTLSTVDRQGLNVE